MSDPIAPHSAPISAYMSVHEGNNNMPKIKKKLLYKKLIYIFKLPIWLMFDTLERLIMQPKPRSRVWTRLHLH